MARQNLASMSVETLLKLRDDIGEVLTRKAGELQRQLARLTGGGPSVGKKGKRGPKSSLKGRKVAPKYRGPGGETWAGRGVRPRWLSELLAQGRSLEEFAIGPAAPKRAVSRKKNSAKRSSRKRK